MYWYIGTWLIIIIIISRDKKKEIQKIKAHRIFCEWAHTPKNLLRAGANPRASPPPTGNRLPI